MLFHLGAFRRLHELGLLGVVSRISSVSGGSIVSAALAVAWAELHGLRPGESGFFAPVSDRVHDIASRTIDVPSVVAGLPPGISAARVLARYYRRYFGNLTLG